MPRVIKKEPAGLESGPLEIIEWLSSNECRELGDAEFVSGLGQRLKAAGLLISRLALHMRIPHPELIGRTVAWAPGEEVEVHDRRHGFLETPAFAGSPLHRVMEARKPLHTRHDGENGVPWTHIDVFQGRQLVEHFIVSLGNRDGPSAASFCTALPQGFSVADCAMIERIVPALRNVCELRVLRHVELILLDTYVGSATARRVLAGHIQRGHVETIEVALMLCDLRGFTELSNRLPSKRILQLLDIYFDRVVPAITDAGGEVLKFMGDGVLAFFYRDQAKAAASAAVESALTALRRLACVSLPDAHLEAGIALHYGEVSYGNIGSGQRLDFTVIGPDVNLVGRIQTVCNNTGQPLLMSERVAGLLDQTQTTSGGLHPLKGFPDPVELYTLRKPIHLNEATKQLWCKEQSVLIP